MCECAYCVRKFLPPFSVSVVLEGYRSEGVPHLVNDIISLFLELCCALASRKCMSRNLKCEIADILSSS